MQEYFNKFNNNINQTKVIKEMTKYALDNKVPIITKAGIEFILQLIRLTNAKKILEIGTAIAYSSSLMALENDDIIVDTIERNELMYNEASKNINKLGLNNRVRVIKNDALEVDEKTLSSDYDLIFIDAAKAQYIKFFEKYEKLLKKTGIIISDNLAFHGLSLQSDKIETKNLRALVRKINDYTIWLSKNNKYRTVFYPIGDGMAVSEKVK